MAAGCGEQWVWLGHKVLATHMLAVLGDQRSTAVGISEPILFSYASCLDCSILKLFTERIYFCIFV